MPVFTQHAPGTFCYCELASADPRASGRFYTELFGWERNDRDLGEFGRYTQFESGGGSVAAQFELPAEQRDNGVVSNWGQYVSVADADAVAAKARELGGQLVMGPMDVFDYGRMAVLADPTGAVFSIWQPLGNIGLTVRNEPGAMCWNELLTTDPAVAGPFYAGLFGWQPVVSEMGDAGTYTMMMRNGTEPAAGMMTITPDAGPVPAHWMVYFEVDDAGAAVGKAGEIGGRCLVQPTEIPGMGSFAVIADPVNATFGVFQPLPGGE
jgi:predicted enzyme related to lactoylglutathione lyase